MALRLKIPVIKQAAYAGEKGTQTVQHGESLPCHGHYSRIGTRALAVGNQEDGFSRRLVTPAHVIYIVPVNTTQRRPVVNHGAHGGIRVCHQRCQAVLHDRVCTWSARTPGIQWIDRKQARVEQLFQADLGGWLDPGKRHIHAVRQVDQKLPFATGIVNRDEATIRYFMGLGEHDQGGRHFVHIVDTLNTVAVEHSLVGVIASGHCARM